MVREITTPAAKPTNWCFRGDLEVPETRARRDERSELGEGGGHVGPLLADQHRAHAHGPGAGDVAGRRR